MTDHHDVEIIRSGTGFLVLKQRRHEKTTELTFSRRGEYLQIGINIVTEYPKRTTYTCSSFYGGPDTADMIAEACTKGALVTAA
jgi:hypothetical protein